MWELIPFDLFRSKDIHIHDEWIWISTWQDEQIQKIAQTNEEVEKKQFRCLRKNGVISQRKTLRLRLENVEISLRVRLSRLNSSLRNRILRDSISVCKKSWQKECSQIFNREQLLYQIRGQKFDCPQLKWDEDKYEKNLVGDLCCFTFQASHPAEIFGVSKAILVDILWSAQICLSKQISQSLSRPLTEKESEICFELSFSLLEPLLFFWERSTSDSGTVSERVCVLPEKWQIEQKEKQRLEREKGADEGYFSNQKDPLKLLISEGKFSAGILVPSEEFEQRKTSLATNLVFRKVE